MLILLVLLIAWISFLKKEMLGTEVLWRYVRALYYSTDLFLFGAWNDGFPKGSKKIFVYLLCICYFAAPLLTLSFGYQLIQEKILSRISPRLKDHTVICGLGRNGNLIYDLIKEYMAKRHKIVLIEKNQQNPYIETVRKKSRDKLE